MIYEELGEKKWKIKKIGLGKSRLLRGAWSLTVDDIFGVGPNLIIQFLFCLIAGFRQNFDNCATGHALHSHFLEGKKKTKRDKIRNFAKISFFFFFGKNRILNLVNLNLQLNFVKVTHNLKFCR